MEQIVHSHHISAPSSPMVKTPDQLMKKQGQITNTPTSVSGPLHSRTMSSSHGCHSKANLPYQLQVEGKWQRVLIPTLLLWAGGNDDVWSVTHSIVAYALPLFMDFDMDLDFLQWTWIGMGPLSQWYISLLVSLD